MQELQLSLNNLLGLQLFSGSLTLRFSVDNNPKHACKVHAYIPESVQVQVLQPLFLVVPGVQLSTAWHSTTKKF